MIIGGLLSVIGATACSNKVPSQLEQVMQPLVLEAQGYCGLDGNQGDSYFQNKTFRKSSRNILL